MRFFTSQEQDCNGGIYLHRNIPIGKLFIITLINEKKDGTIEKINLALNITERKQKGRIVLA
ncbi:MAG: hypothetical protein ACI976_002302 [Aureispira sp.]|jgi:hypothetical protein